MTSKVVSLRGSAVAVRQPVQITVELAEQILEAAKSGEIIGLAVVQTFHDGTSNWRYAGVSDQNGTVGCLEYLKRDLMTLFSVGHGAK